MADGRQDAVVHLHAAKQQRVVGDDDVCRFGEATGPVQVAARVEGASLLEAVVEVGAYRIARQAVPVDVQRIEVAQVVWLTKWYSVAIICRTSTGFGSSSRAKRSSLRRHG